MAKARPDPALTPQEFSFQPSDGTRLPCPGRGRVEYHERSTGLRLRVTAAGARTWAVSYWSALAKTQRRLKLGNPAKLTLGEARKRAREALAVVDKGGDPFLERRATLDREVEARRARAAERRRRAEERSRRTFGEVVDAYVKWRRETPGGRFQRRASAKTLAGWASLVRLHVRPIVGEIRPEAIRQDHFVAVMDHAVTEGGPAQGPRVRELLAAVWRWMESRTRLLGVRLPPESPLRQLPRNIGAAARERERTLSPAEVWKLWRATESEGLHGLALRFMLLSAARVNEVAELPAEEIETEAKAWRLPAERSKGGTARTIPLSKQALAVLKQARALHQGAYVFARVRVTERMARIRAAMGGEPWQPRDLRRTAATICARLGADPFTVSLALGHANADSRAPAVTRTYLRWRYDDEVRNAVEKLGAWVEQTVTSAEAPGAVAEFRR